MWCVCDLRPTLLFSVVVVAVIIRDSLLALARVLVIDWLAATLNIKQRDSITFSLCMGVCVYVMSSRQACFDNQHTRIIIM